MLPTMLYVLVAGALSDRFGRKPLLLFPMAGSVIEAATYLAGYHLFYRVPLWFFHLTAAYDLAGGFTIYFMGVYGFGSNSTSQERRATRLARYDGVEQASFMAGAALSPLLFRAVGTGGCLWIGVALKAGALAYMAFCTEEPVKR